MYMYCSQSGLIDKITTFPSQHVYRIVVFEKSQHSDFLWQLQVSPKPESPVISTSYLHLIPPDGVKWYVFTHDSGRSLRCTFNDRGSAVTPSNLHAHNAKTGTQDLTHLRIPVSILVNRDSRKQRCWKWTCGVSKDGFASWKTLMIPFPCSSRTHI